MKKATIILIAVFAGLLAACAPADATPMAVPTGTSQEVMSQPVMQDANATALPVATSADFPSWFNETLQNVSTGESFTIGEHAGKVVIVELMAMWCSTCLAQQTALKSTLARLDDPTDLVVIVVDVDANERAQDLGGYAQQHGFSWIYAVATPELARAIGNEYGPLYLQPPAAPMLVIDRSGTVHPLPVGYKNEVQLENLLNPILVQP